MALLTRKTQIALKAETNEGNLTAPVTPGVADAAFNIFEAGFSNDIEQFERNPFRSSVGHMTSIAGVKTGTISFTSELVGSGSAATAPAIGKLLAPCGFREQAIDKLTGTITGTFLVGETVSGTAGSSTVAAVTSDAVYVVATATAFTGTITTDSSDTDGQISTPTYAADVGFVYQSRTTPSTYSSTDVPSAALTMYNDGIKHRIQGARGNLSLRASTGQPVQASFEFMGPLVDTTNGTMLSGISYPTATPPTLLSAAFTVQGFAGVIDSLEVSTNNELAARRSANATAGVISTKIVSRAPTGSIDPEATVVTGTGSHDWWGKLSNNTEGSLEITIGSATGNKFMIIAPNTQYSGISVADRNGIAVNQVDLSFNESSLAVDDDIQILAL